MVNVNMKKLLIPVVCIGSLILLVCGAVVNAGNNCDTKGSGCNIRVFDAQKVLGGYYKIREIGDELAVKVEAAKKELQTMIDQSSKLRKELDELKAKSENPAVADEAKDKFKKEAEAKETELLQKEMEVNKFRNEADTQLFQMQQSRLMEQVDVIKKAVEEIAKAKNVVMVINKANQDIFYADDSLDLSDEILEKLNASAPKPDDKVDVSSTKANNNGVETVKAAK
jgi:outer membrane protein